MKTLLLALGFVLGIFAFLLCDLFVNYEPDLVKNPPKKLTEQNLKQARCTDIKRIKDGWEANCPASSIFIYAEFLRPGSVRNPRKGN